jgi:phage antirepressor YoqD-like protein
LEFYLIYIHGRHQWRHIMPHSKNLGFFNIKKTLKNRQDYGKL